MSTGLRAVVPAQVVAPPPLSLVTMALGPPPGDNPRWTQGFEYLPEGCSGAGRGDPWAATQDKPIPDNPAIVAFDPFYVWTGFRCTTMQSRNREELNARAERLLNACTPSQVEAEFWRGDVARSSSGGTNPMPNNYLANPATVKTLGTGPVDIMDALSCLEDALATCSCQGRAMIHATPGVVQHWVHLGAIRREGQSLLTPTDNYVVPGSGYDGSGPGALPGDAPVPATTGSVWAYATDRVTVRLDDPKAIPDNEAQAVDRSTNDEAWRAERLAAATFDGCCHIAIEIDVVTCAVSGS